MAACRDWDIVDRVVLGKLAQRADMASRWYSDAFWSRDCFALNTDEMVGTSAQARRVVQDATPEAVS